MHNLALALHHKGYKVSGSDDEIFEPSKSRLEKAGLLPQAFGWFPEKISKRLDAVILGMHARADNPELLKAKELGLKIFSYPEYLYEQSRHKTRIVIGGSHGKTTITSMILHIMKEAGLESDYMVGAQLEGFDVMVKLTEEAKYMVIEGDEYLTSPIDLRPKFHLYRPHIAVLSGIAWDHFNVFPTFEIYLNQFRKFISLIEEGGKLFYCDEDEHLQRLAKENIRPEIDVLSYNASEYTVQNGQSILSYKEEQHVLKIFGRHNLMNLNVAIQVCKSIGIPEEVIMKAAESFKGASNRLELLASDLEVKVFRDFAHSPSKVKATVNALKEQFPQLKKVAALELHTFSSLNPVFLPQYANTMDAADVALVYFNPHALEHKKLPALEKSFVKQCFGENVEIFNDSMELQQRIKMEKGKGRVFLLMSSGNFNGVDVKEFANQLIEG